MPKQIKQYLIALLVLGLVFVANSVIWAWTTPTAAPPGGNVAAPVNVSSVAQDKAGDLAIGSGLNYWLTKYFDSFALKNNAGQIKFVLGQDGHVGIGVLAPGVDLEVAGKIKMNTQTVDGDSDTTAVTKGYMNSKIGSGPGADFKWFIFNEAGVYLKEGARAIIKGSYSNGGRIFEGTSAARVYSGNIQTRSYVSRTGVVDSGWVNGNTATACHCTTEGWPSRTTLCLNLTTKAFAGGVKGYVEARNASCTGAITWYWHDTWLPWEFPDERTYPF